METDHKALGWRLMQLKGMGDLAAFSAREVMRVAARKETSILLQKERQSQSKKQSDPSELFEN